MVKQVKSVDEFNKLIESDELVVVDFFTKWCGPCKTIAPKIKILQDDYSKVKFVKVDAEDEDLEEIVKKHHVNSFPTFIFFKSGEKIDRFSGAYIDKLIERVEKYG
jgi:thioredoxin 1